MSNKLNINSMFKYVKKLNLYVLILIVSVLSLLLIDKVVLAQWMGPEGPPGDPIVPGLVTNPLQETFDLGEYGFTSQDKEDYQIDFDNSINVMSSEGYWIANKQALTWEDPKMKIPQDLEVSGMFEVNLNSTLEESENVIYANAKNSAEGNFLKFEKSSGKESFNIDIEGNVSIKEVPIFTCIGTCPGTGLGGGHGGQDH